MFALKQGHSFPGIGDAVLINGTWFGPKYRVGVWSGLWSDLDNDRRSDVGFKKRRRTSSDRPYNAHVSPVQR